MPLPSSFHVALPPAVPPFTRGSTSGRGLPLGMVVDPCPRVAVLSLRPLRNDRIFHVLHVLVVVRDRHAPVGIGRRVLGGLRLDGELGVIRRENGGCEEKRERYGEEAVKH